MKKSIFLFLFPLAFITLVPISICFAIQNDQIQKPINSASDTDDSDSEELILEEELEQLKNEYQNRKKEIDPGIVPGDPEVQNDKVDPGIFLSDPEESKNNIDPGIVK